MESARAVIGISLAVQISQSGKVVSRLTTVTTQIPRSQDSSLANTFPVKPVIKESLVCQMNDVNAFNTILLYKKIETLIIVLYRLFRLFKCPHVSGRCPQAATSIPYPLGGERRTGFNTAPIKMSEIRRHQN